MSNMCYDTIYVSFVRVVKRLQYRIKISELNLSSVATYM